MSPDCCVVDSLISQWSMVNFWLTRPADKILFASMPLGENGQKLGLEIITSKKNQPPETVLLTMFQSDACSSSDYQYTLFISILYLFLLVYFYPQNIAYVSQSCKDSTVYSGILQASRLPTKSLFISVSNITITAPFYSSVPSLIGSPYWIYHFGFCHFYFKFLFSDLKKF